MVVSDNIKQLMDILLIQENHPLFGVIKRKAGIWQGIDSFKDMDMLILRDVNYRLEITSLVELIEQSKPDLVWAESHFQERIGGVPLNPGESYKIWPYAKFDEKNDPYLKGKQFDHSYMERFWPKNANEDLIRRPYPKHVGQNRGIRFELGDYNDVCQQLINNPLNRQAYLPIFFPEDTGAKNNMRVPCTLGYLFEIFEDKLDVTYYIRSCDAYRHLRNDIYMAGRLLQHTKEILFINGMKDIQTGTLKMKIANLHIFENDLYNIKKKESKL
jgi:hypothetical protein